MLPTISGAILGGNNAIIVSYKLSQAKESRWQEPVIIVLKSTYTFLVSNKTLIRAYQLAG